MARYALIDDYLDAMRDGLSWRRDLDDLVSEMEDHLYSTVEHMCSRGQESALAERKALDRFGDPKTLASVYASTKTGGLAVPTNFTRTAGLMAIAAAVLLIPVAVIAAFDVVNGDDWQLYYTLGMVALLGAAVMMVILALGLKQRSGARGALPIVALAFGVIGTVGTVMWWFTPGWAIPIGISTLVMAWIVLRAGAAPAVPTVLYGIGFLAGAVTFLIARALEVGTVDEWGDYPAAWAAGVVVACTVTAIGLFGLGTWLRHEEPVDIDSTPINA